jgi:drug/metabolite transporter (DMT)-like permease
MAATEQLRWQRAFPARATRRLVWFALGGGALVMAVWGLFGTEPERLPSGEANLLAALPTVTVVLVAALAVPVLVAVIRRPMVALRT